jgi:ABC-type transport system involved in multi-copper enzyme maturation permease subunit
LLGPIFVREWLTVPRRTRHYVVRSAYLGLLWVLGLTAWQALIGWSETATLGDTARFGLRLFQIYGLVQLILVSFFAALSAASAVAQEKDRRTFVLILLTDLRNYEIVLGKLFGSLLQIVLLLVGMVPVLALILLLGGISPGQVAQAVLVLAASALTAGSLGGLIALWRDKTFQALALTVLFLVLYLCLVRGLTVVPRLAAALSNLVPTWGCDWSFEMERLAATFGSIFSVANVEAWQRWLDPNEALQSVLEPTGLAVPPAVGFAGVMVLLSVLLNAWAIVRLRVWNPSGEQIVQRERPEEEEDKDRARAHAAPGRVRRVWANPVLWREIATRAYGRRALLVKLAYFLVLGLVCYYALAPLWTADRRPPPFAAAYGLVPVGILSLLLVSAQAVTAITTERDSGALDLLLVTDLTPREFIFGKLWGICYNTKEYLIPPIALAAVYASHRLLATPHVASTNVEALVCIAVGSVILLAFAITLGVHVALRTENSRVAISNTLGTAFFLSVGTLVCIYLILINGRFEYQWTSFILFIASGIGGLWWVLSGDRPSAALTLASWLCPLAMFYSVTNILIAKPGLEESTDPFIPFVVTAGAFGFTVVAMLIPLLSEFDVALGRTTGGGE